MAFFSPKPIDLTKDEASELVHRIDTCNLSSKDKTMIKGVLNFSFWLESSLRDAKVTIKKLYRIFNFTSDKRTKSPNKTQSKSSDSKEANDDPEPDDKTEIPSPTKLKGHGRLSINDYDQVVDVKVPHQTLSTGQECPLKCDGVLYENYSANVLRITGGSLANATNYQLERLRCALCGNLFKASLPVGVSQDKYDTRFKSLLAINKYYMGMPFCRIKTFQSLIGVPLPESTQWDLIEQLADCVYPVFDALEKYAAQGEFIQADDTRVRILSVMKENKKPPDKKTRKGTYTTSIISKINGHAIYLFHSSRQHAGENVSALVDKRAPNLEPVKYMCDALSANMPNDLNAIVFNCLAHARRKFVELEPYFPNECKVVLDVIGKVYKWDNHAKDKSYCAEERLLLHKTHSKPILDTLKIWLDAQINDNLVEPNSNLGKAIQYMRNHWVRLTRFVEVAGTPLDNNLVETTLKIPIRVRKNAHFYATEHGAFIASMLQSLIQTCAAARINPIDYLTALQDNKSQIFKEPKSWFPWCYQETIRNHQLECAA